MRLRSPGVIRGVPSKSVSPELMGAFVFGSRCIISSTRARASALQSEDPPKLQKLPFAKLDLRNEVMRNW